MTATFISACDHALAISPPATSEVDTLVARFYAMPGNSTGGALHIVLDDTNIGDDAIRWCVERAEKASDLAAAALGRVLLAVPFANRLDLAFVCRCGCIDELYRWQLAQKAAPPPRYFNMDGTRHSIGDTTDCSCSRTCEKCGSRLHSHGAYGCLLEMCERCDIGESTTNLADAGEP